MPAVPRIARAMPAPAGIKRLDEPVPVIARLHWNTSMGCSQDVQAWALSVSPAHEGSEPSVLICWDGPEGPRTDWVARTEVRNPGDPYTGEPHLPFMTEPLPLIPGVIPGPAKPTEWDTVWGIPDPT